jgi:serine/threonine protein kinase
LKAENILLDSRYQIKLADLGSAIEYDEAPDELFFGSDEYNAPEVLKHFEEVGNGAVDYDKFKGDIFSLGVLLFIMVLGLAPFRCAKRTDPYFLRLSEAPDRFWKIFRDYRISEKFKDLF